VSDWATEGGILGRPFPVSQRVLCATGSDCVPSGLTLRPSFWAEPWENPKRLPSIKPIEENEP
jgi:hypothetical protein